MDDNPIIDREEAVQLFYQLLDQQQPERYLRLYGLPKMGKTHLLTKSYPLIARQKNAICQVIDLRNSSQTINDFLHIAANGLIYDYDGEFNAAYSEWINKPQIKITGMQSLLSSIVVHGKNEKDDTKRIIPHLTRSFVNDLRVQNDRQLLLIFDAVEQCAPETRTWLTDSLLVQLQPLTHVFVVLGGRQLPELSSSYLSICLSHELGPVKKEVYYIKYCRAVGVTLVEQSIRDIAHLLGYVPGHFAEAIQRFVPNQ